MRSAWPDISILGVEIGIQSKISEDLLSHNVNQGFSVSSSWHYDVGGVIRSPCIFIHSIKEEGSVREGLSGKGTSKLDAVVQVKG